MTASAVDSAATSPHDDAVQSGTDAAAWEALLESASREPWAHDFRALLRRIEALHPELPRLGTAARPQHEPLRLAQEPELDFAPAALASLKRKGAQPPRLGVRFFGLFGPHGPMPLHFTEHVRERSRQYNDPATLRFLDIFHHRLLTLLYRSWAQSQPVVQHDRPSDDRYAVWLGACSGIPNTDAAQPLQRAELHAAGILSQRTRSAEGLARLLALQLGELVHVETNVGQWLDVEPEDQSTLGYAANRPERLKRAPARLGVNACIGHKVWDRQYRFRLLIGPLRAERYKALLPGGEAHQQIAYWVTRYVGHDYRWDLQLVLHREDALPLRLGQPQALGYMSWLGDRMPQHTGSQVSAAVAKLRSQGHRTDLRLVAGSAASPGLH